MRINRRVEGTPGHIESPGLAPAQEGGACGLWVVGAHTKWQDDECHLG